MKHKFSIYETETGKFEYLVNNQNLPKIYKTLSQAEKANSNITEPSSVIRAKSGKSFFIIKNEKSAKYLEELKNRFSETENFLNYINGN